MPLKLLGEMVGDRGVEAVVGVGGADLDELAAEREGLIDLDPVLGEVERRRVVVDVEDVDVEDDLEVVRATPRQPQTVTGLPLSVERLERLEVGKVDLAEVILREVEPEGAVSVAGGDGQRADL